ncbi:MAG: SCO family protein [Thiohalomonadaceae bacterium]
MSDRILGLLALVMASLVVGLALFWNPLPAVQPSAYPVLPRGGDFTLQSADGPVSLRDFRGKVVLVFFGYTFCPDICPTALVAVADAMEQLKPKEKRDVAVLFVSVDPERDTPQGLKQYTAFFHPNIIGVTGSAEQVRKVAQDYGAIYARQPGVSAGGGYVVDHSADIYVVSGDGRVVDKISHGATSARIATSIRNAMRFS